MCQRTKKGSKLATKWAEDTKGSMHEQLKRDQGTSISRSVNKSQEESKRPIATAEGNVTRGGLDSSHHCATISTADVLFALGPSPAVDIIMCSLVTCTHSKQLMDITFLAGLMDESILYHVCTE